MLRGLGILMLIGLLAVATVGLAGGGPSWMRYIGSGTVFAFLILILGQLSQLPNKEEYQAMFAQPEGGEELYSADDALSGGSDIQVPQKTKRTRN
jgi:hypothetical protein